MVDIDIIDSYITQSFYVKNILILNLYLLIIFPSTVNCKKLRTNQSVSQTWETDQCDLSNIF